MISMVIPTLNEEEQIGHIIDFLKRQALVSEIIVIDDGSHDETFNVSKARGAKVFLSSMLGKGASMKDGLRRCRNDVVLFLDGDIYNFSDDIVDKMALPIINSQADLVKGRFSRTAGRVTMLTALPLIKTFFPELTGFEQPLGGVVAGHKCLLEELVFENDYGVDVGILIDAWHCGARVFEADIGPLEHDHQPLGALSKMSLQVVRTILDRAAKYDRLHLNSVAASLEVDRVGRTKSTSILSSIGPDKKMVLFDMDGTLIEGSFVEHLADQAGIKGQLDGFLGNHALDALQRAEAIAKELTGIPKSFFEKVAMEIPLKPMAQETVVALRRLGFQVGIISDSYFIACDIVMRRVFADFAVAHVLRFKGGTATGDIAASPLMKMRNGCSLHTLCKSNFMGHLVNHFKEEMPEVFAVGNGENDICLFARAKKSFAIYPASVAVTAGASVELGSLSDILEHL